MVFIHVGVDLYTYMNLSYSDLVLALSPQLRILRGSEVTTENDNTNAKTP